MNCQHELQHCAHCDTVTCMKCQKVWGQQTCDLNHYPYMPAPVVIPSTPWPTWLPWGVTWGGDTSPNYCGTNVVTNGTNELGTGRMQ